MRRLASGAVLLVLVYLWPAQILWAQPRSGRPLALTEIDGHQAVAGEVLVALAPHAPARTWDELGQLGDGDLPRPAGRSGVRLFRSRTLDTARLRDRLAAHPLVRYAEPNWIVRALSDPGDPMTPQLWGLVNTGQSVNGGLAGREGADINAAAAWSLSTGSTVHVVAVVDSGVDYTHPDLVPNLWTAPSAFTVTVQGQSITCPAGSHGFDAIGKTCDPMDDHNHGTHVAGTIAAAGGNGQGVVGVNWTARIMALRFIDASGSGTIADAIAAIEFAMEARRAFAGTGAADVRVLSNSWGGRSYSQALADTIAAAADEDMLFVAAAGNDGFSNDVLPLYPASYALPNVVAVAATTNTDGLAWFSNYGTASVHLGAPGVDILSTVRGQSYAFASGTSMATPHVSGAAALVLSRCALDTAALRSALLDTVERSSELAMWTITGGRLDVYSAMRSCLGSPDAPATLTAAAGDGRVELSWSSAAGATAYSVGRSLTSGGPYTTIATGVTAQTFSDLNVTNGTQYFYVVRGSNAFGDGPPSPEASATPKTPADLIVSALTVPAVAGAGSSIAVSATTKNLGAGTSAATVTRFFLSTDLQPDAGDVVLGEVPVPALSPSGTYTANLTLTLPSGVPTGSYYVVALSDAGGVESEPSETNNELAKWIRIGPDLVVSASTVPATAAAGQTIVVSETVKNQGGGPAGQTTTRFYLSTNATIDASDIVLNGSRAVPELGASLTSTGSTSLLIPPTMATGTYYVIVKADADNAVGETTETNNTMARSLKIGPDLTVTLAAPSVSGAGETLVVTDTAKNQGASSSAPSTTRFYLSTNSTLDAGDALLPGSRSVPALTGGASSSGTTTLTLPAPFATGTYYLIAKVDHDDVVDETNESNNTTARAVAIGPDLRIAAITVPYSQQAGVASTVSMTVENRGGGAAGASVTRFYLSTNTTLDAADVALDAVAQVSPLSAGSQTAVTAAVTVPEGTPAGIYYVFAKVDADGAVSETAETNNVSWRTVNVSVP